MGDRSLCWMRPTRPFFMRFEILKRHREDLEDLLPTKLGVWGKALLQRESVRQSVVDDFEERFIRFGKSKDSFILADA